jgi:hypothetical protein
VWKFVFPGTVVKPDKQKEAGQEENIKNDISNPDSVFDKKESEIDSKGHIQHQPKYSSKNSRNYFF